uniref:NADP-dependent oxidoreductase domain-containing protein n=1 Tax=Cyprinus carpio TaxID=7962 RepID=A0A8C1NJW9_CYPCA
IASQHLMLMSGVQMPLLGWGTYQLQDHEQLKQSVTSALIAGYRGFDTGAVYGNDAHLGQVLKELEGKGRLEELWSDPCPGSPEVGCAARHLSSALVLAAVQSSGEHTGI